MVPLNMQSFKQHLTENLILESFQYHLDNNIAFDKCLFRPGSKKYFEFYCALKECYQSELFENYEFNNDELEMIHSDLGIFAEYHGALVPLDFIIEEKPPELNKPKRGGNAKYIVYVRNPQTGNIKKIQFGDTTGLTAKYNNPERKKAFAARHNCADTIDKLSRAYWACRINKYLGKTPQSRAGYW